MTTSIISVLEERVSSKDNVPPEVEDEIRLSRKTTEGALVALLNIHPDEVKLMDEIELECIWAKVEVFVDLIPHVFSRRYCTHVKSWAHDTYPLSILCAFQAPLALVKSVYAIFPHAATESFAVACSYGVNLTILNWLNKKVPSAVKYQWPECQTYALHGVVCGRAPLEIVQYVYELYPIALTQKDRLGNTPLHIAFPRASMSTIQFLVAQVNDDALQAADKYNDTPLHLAFLNSDHNVADSVVRWYPDFIKQPRNVDGWYPLHFACRNVLKEEYIVLLLNYYPEAAAQKDDKGRLPLDLAYENEYISDDVLTLLVQS